MHLAEVVVGEMQRDGGFVHRHLFAEPISQAGEAAHVHPHREIRPFDKRRGNVSGVGLALDPLRGIYEWATERGYESRAEHIIISDFPVKFLPAPDALSEEAVTNAAAVQSGGVQMKVVRPEYLIALWQRPGPASTFRRRERAAKLRESVQLDTDVMADLKARYNF